MTTFQEKVYQFLRTIPKGKVVTYTDLAITIGRKKAVRAVGNALHHNPDMVIVPCHRVVRSDGSVGGYAGGIEKKISLLRKEGVIVENGQVDLVRYRWVRYT
ncbi:MAG TPA: MGMT family protein [Candidatus Kapabacteria bacterium]|nr:MGMT family protein [Candidatus Kapabacteria bacterium]